MSNIPMKKFAGVILSVLLVASLFAGCTPKEPTPPVSGPISLTDMAGRAVELEQPATKVVGTHNVSLNYAVVLSGDGSVLVGFGNKDMAYGLYDKVFPGYGELTSIGKGKEINYETVASLKAELALVPTRFISQAESYEQVGCKVIILDVEKFDSIKEALTLVGKAIGKEERAEQIKTFFDGKITQMTELTANVANKPKVLMLGSSSATSVAHDAMLQNQIIATAGGVCADAGFEATGGFADVDMETIVGWNPEVIYIPAYAKYTVQDILDDPAWQGITAVQNKAVYMFPSAVEPWDYPTTSAALGLCWVTYNLHPELYSYDDLIKDVNEYYSFTYNTTFTPEELGLK
ncbi:MAG: ABC transporter substrate-binding protein [Eubacteriaceae bacterium]|nr:ABC transporter substrate-binding protein [Eubacteriaceae bacterium]